MLSSRRSIISISSNSSRILVRGFSQVPEKLEKKIVYQSKYGEKIKRLRKISLSSSIISTFMLPVPLFVESTTLPFLGQMALIGTILFSSVSSTVLLAGVTSPYVTRLEELSLTSSPSSSSSRVFSAYRMNVRGKEIPTVFTLEEATKKTSHPFASFSLKDSGNFYIYGGEMEDEELKTKLTKE